MAAPPVIGFFDYLKAAFVNHWNLLLLGAGTAVAFISGQPDVVLPLMAAGELAYLASLTRNERFQNAVAMGILSQHEDQQAAGSEERAARSLQNLMGGLDKRSLQAFDSLQERCGRLQEIVARLRGEEPVRPTASLDESKEEGINRLLWVYLKLLYTRDALGKFFASTDLGAIKASIAHTAERIQDLGEGTDATTEKMRRTLLDTLQTAKLRHENYERAEANAKFIGLELERIEVKINSILELAINQRDPAFISREVDNVASSIRNAEETMHELEVITGLGDASTEAVPRLMRAQGQQIG